MEETTKLLVTAGVTLIIGYLYGFNAREIDKLIQRYPINS